MAYRILVSAPVPLVLIGFLNWVGVGPRGFGDKVVGTGLDKEKYHPVSVIMNSKVVTNRSWGSGVLPTDNGHFRVWRGSDVRREMNNSRGIIT